MCDCSGASLFRPECTPPKFRRGQSDATAKSFENSPEQLPTVFFAIRRQPSAKDDDIMFGPFRATNPLSSGLLWKIPWRLSKFQKRRHRLRLRAVDSVVATLDTALAKRGQTLEAIERWKAEMPTEEEMLPKDKYTMFDRKEKKYRKGIHSMGFLCFLFLWLGESADADDFFNRIAKVDESFAESQPSWILKCRDENGYINVRQANCNVFWLRKLLRDERRKMNDEHIRRYISSDLLYTIYHFTLRWSTLGFTGRIEI